MQIPRNFRRLWPTPPPCLTFAPPLWLGARLLVAGCNVIPWPDELDELAAAYFARHPPVARA